MSPLLDPVFGPIFLVGTIIAGACDLHRRRISNAQNLVFGLAGLGYQGLYFGLEGLATGLAGLLTALLIALLPFILGVYKGGDVKLLMALGASLGPRSVTQAFLFGVVLGLPLAFLTKAMGQAARGVPMAVAFGLGAVGSCLWPL